MFNALAYALGFCTLLSMHALDGNLLIQMIDLLLVLAGMGLGSEG